MPLPQPPAKHPDQATAPCRTRRTSRSIWFVALCAFVCGTGVLAWLAFQETSVYFLNVSEALAAPRKQTTNARLFGTVAGQDLTRTADGMHIRFRLEDKDNPALTLLVTYTGALPDTFKPGAEVIVEGSLADNAFTARSLMTKCPSKYEKENRK